MNFDITVESIHTPALSLDYHLVPWDSQIIGQPVAQISQISVADPHQAARDFEAFIAWRERHGIQLCACRVEGKRLVDSIFLEEQGFRFIELNYLPRLDNLQSRKFVDSGIMIKPAATSERHTLAEMAARVLTYGRFHQDPRIDPVLGARRYRTWMINAFERPSQTVLQCLSDDQVVAFFVIESPTTDHRFWSLIGLAPGLQGRGLGKRVWNAMLLHHRNEGVEIVSTSISSHNVPVFNLYVSLGFRFPTPSMTLQWRPPGSGLLAADI